MDILFLEPNHSNDNSIFIKEILEAINPDAVVLEGFNAAIIGICSRPGMEDVLAYNKSMILEILEIDHNMEEDEALEYYSYNIAGMWTGDGTPVFIDIY